MKNILLVIVFIILVSCSSTSKVTEVPITIEQQHTEYIKGELKDTISFRDSVYITDSIYIEEKGDTLYCYKTRVEYKYKTQYKYSIKKDTLCIRDSIPYPVTITEYKEVTTNVLYWYQKLLIYLGIGTIIIVLTMLGINYIKKVF
jgi:hypothetical protein